MQGNTKEFSQSYLFKLDVQTINLVDISIDFSDSESLLLQNSEGLIANATVKPFSSALVAILRLARNWRLKYRLKLLIKFPSIEQ